MKLQHLIETHGILSQLSTDVYNMNRESLSIVTTQRQFFLALQVIKLLPL